MAKKPLNPDSVKGGGMPAMGRSSQGASAAANKRAGAGQRAADLMNRGANAAQARLKAEFKAKGLNWETGLPNNAAAAAKLRAQGAAYRANLKVNRVTELEKRLSSPSQGKTTVTRSYGTINKKGLEKLNNMPEPTGLSPRNFPQRGK